ncbi:hypothetical protein GVN16_17365 [Emticicia sp. CRIBPO]|uniref:hypothetical protein n=1 Tax=Emticicia sp. CRIBPO TaxID=2683258 RepID=UPI0014128940|nr:hypothetical protein [Emticicia sp. CRIBPO]NBA87545.1 hypothetical protein [Emticicia sp. CRIBPO]
MKLKLCIVLFVSAISACSKTDDISGPSGGTYTGTGSVSQGKGTTTVNNFFTAGQRVAALGTISSSDNKTWTVPAEVNFTNTSFPFASDLFNSYVPGHGYSTSANALAALSGSDVVTVDNSGEIYTAYIFADNYFEMYVNGVPVGKDPVPYTDFNASIVRFKALKPFTIAVKCVDWEENLGLGTESQGSSANYVGDGGFVAVIKNASGAVVAITNNTWKAQTFYTSPVTDLSCLTETGNYRYSGNCSTTSATANSYCIHWALPGNWFNTSYDDSGWPAASTFTNASAGVDNKSSYTNFRDIFDNSSNDASFIWSTNLLLDNLVLLRKKVE